MEADGKLYTVIRPGDLFFRGTSMYNDPGNVQALKEYLTQMATLIGSPQSNAEVVRMVDEIVQLENQTAQEMIKVGIKESPSFWYSGEVVSAKKKVDDVEKIISVVGL
jgi:hypothetical protein